MSGSEIDYSHSIFEVCAALRCHTTGSGVQLTQEECIYYIRYLSHRLDTWRDDTNLILREYDSAVKKLIISTLKIIETDYFHGEVVKEFLRNVNL